MKQNCAALLRLTANLEFAACNLIASIEEQSPNLINDYIVYVDKLNDDGLSSIKKVCQYYGKQAVVREYSLNIDLKKDGPFFKRYPAIVFSLFEIFDCLREYKNVIALDVDMLVLSDISDLLGYKPIGFKRSRILADIFKDSKEGDEFKGVVTPNAGCIVANEKLLDFGISTKSCYEVLQQYINRLKDGFEEAVISLLLCKLKVPFVLVPEEFNCSLSSANVNTAKIVHYYKVRKPWDSVYSLLAIPEYSGVVDIVNGITNGSLKNINTVNTGYQGVLNRLFNMKFNEQIYSALEREGMPPAVRPTLNIEYSFLEFSLSGTNGKIKYIVRHNRKYCYLGDNFLHTCGLSQINQLEMQIKIFHSDSLDSLSIVAFLKRNGFEKVEGKYFHYKKVIPVRCFLSEFKKITDSTCSRLQSIYEVLTWD